MQLTKIPSTELVEEVYRQMELATKEEYEYWRKNVCDAFAGSSAREGIPTEVKKWVEEQVTLGKRTIEEIASGGLGGAMLSAFQLGLLVGSRLREEKVN